MSVRRCPTTEKVQEMVNSIAFPVDCVFLAVVDTDPATLLGYGTWQRVAQGRFLVGQNDTDPDFDTAEETGGAKTINLAHTHDNHTMTDVRSQAGISAVTGPTTHASNLSAAQNILPPYFVVYIWIRTA